MTQPESFYAGNGRQWSFIDTPGLDSVPGKSEQAMILRKVLLQRGISGADEAKNFMEPSLAELHDPFLMKDMRVAAERIRTAIEKKEHILVYGDYDVDGTTAVSILLSFFRRHGADCSFYIPDRVDEGYGVSPAAVALIGADETDLMITVDCGITAGPAIEAIQAAHAVRGRRIDIIVSDHHQLHEGTFPACLAVLNPHRPDCPYPFKPLCGTGIAFKIVDAVCRLGATSAQRIDPDSAERTDPASNAEKDAPGALQQCGPVAEEALDWIDLAALATIADIVDLNGENRAIASLGIARMNVEPNIGLSRLMAVAGMKPGTMDAGKVGFSIAPRLNAAGRMGDASRAVRLLTTGDGDEADTLARDLEKANQTRQQTQEDIFRQAVDSIRQDPVNRSRKVLVVWGDGWHHGVIGIVASKLVELFHKPVFVMAVADGEAIGSGRSVEGYHLFEALESVTGVLKRFGGHAQAGGVTLDIGGVESFTEQINRHADLHMDDACRTPVLRISAELQSSALTMATAKTLMRLEPFGQGNKPPVFITRGLIVTDASATSDGRHLKLKFKADDRQIEAISFGDGPLLPHLSPGMALDAAYVLERNEWMGRESLKMRIVDLRMTEGEAARNAFMLKTASKLESLDCDEEWLYNEIKQSGHDPERLIPTPSDYGAVYRHLAKREMKGLSRTDLFLTSRRIFPSDGAFGWLKLFIALLVFDELGLLSFTLNPDDTYDIACDPSPEKVDLTESGLVQLLGAVTDAF